MTPEISTYLYIGSTLIAATIYYLTYRYQAKKIDILEKAISSQSSLITDFEKFKKLLDVDDYKKNRDLQLENQKIQLTRFFEKEAEKLANNVADNMNKRYIETNSDLLGMVQELIQFPIHMTIKQYPDKSQKTERDKFIKQNYPHSADKLIGFCDAVIAGQVVPDDPSQ